MELEKDYTRMNQDEFLKLYEEQHSKGEILELSNIKFDYLNLGSQIDLQGIKLTDCYFNHCSFNQVNFSKSIITNTQFNHCSFNQVNFSKSIITNTQFHYCSFWRDSFNSCQLQMCKFCQSRMFMTDLTYIVIKDSMLVDTSINDCNFYRAKIIKTPFTRCVNTYSNFEETVFHDCEFTQSHFTNNEFEGCAGLDSIICTDSPCFRLSCPEEGSFIGFKVAQTMIWKGLGLTEPCQIPVVVKLLIPEDAKRSSADSRKCRCNKAKVLSIISFDGVEEFAEARSLHDENFTYTVREEVQVDDFEDNRWKECAPGIHFFITRQEAIDYWTM